MNVEWRRNWPELGELADNNPGYTTLVGPQLLAALKGTRAAIKALIAE